GILIATTNLIESIDQAFDRRFLYKLKFDLPDRETRAKIWRHYLPDMSIGLVKKASLHELSGGEIENVARRLTMERMFEQSEFSEIRLKALIGEENGFRCQGRRVGFTG
ncbi:MAG: ATP-binding protein, partial [Candidatus Wallbacteria bacterium]|nr:ATP-binding protein [Candidatus Wallbacteria bacterium]